MPEDQRNFLALLGYVFLQNARPDKAAVVLAALDLMAPGDARAMLALAMAQLRSGKPERALDTLDRLAMAGGADAAFHLLRAQALAACGRAPDAAQAMATYLRLRPASTTPSSAAPALRGARPA